MVELGRLVLVLHAVGRHDVLRDETGDGHHERRVVLVVEQLEVVGNVVRHLRDVIVLVGGCACKQCRTCTSRNE